MEIVRNEDKIVIRDDKEIESYDFNSEINFNKLINYLLKNNLSKKINLDNNIKDPTEAEDNLIKLIQKIINDYNTKVEELDKFKNDNTAAQE